jgi:hypothetical protein
MTWPKMVLLAGGVPALISGIVGAAIYAYLAASPPRVPQTVAEAVATRARIRLVELVRHGADPNQRVDMRLARVAGKHPIRVTPLMLAIARDDADFVRLLIAMGVNRNHDDRRDAFCLAVMLASRFETLVDDPAIERSTCPERLDRLRVRRASQPDSRRSDRTHPSAGSPAGEHVDVQGPPHPSRPRS